MSNTMGRILVLKKLVETGNDSRVFA